MMPADLFEAPKVGAFPIPRPFQDTAHQALREGFRRGHRNQLLVAPTGSGKTVIGLRIIHEALQKGKRAVFVCDRTALIDQTSARADDYGLTNHGIVQADHWRRNNDLPFQIASIQTIQARGYWPDADVIVIDEAHTQYTATKELLERATVPIIGLTATPCTKGLGKFYASMVNAATMHELTQSGVLVPLRILSCTTPDMKGAKTSGGEWTNKAAAEREAKIIGDVVAEWFKFGEGRKTIAFGADIAYCTQLVQRFNEAGVFARTFTADTPKAERDELLAEFSKPDSAIRILVSVEALAKGFDVPDIGCVIDARPLRKSLSTAIQMWGRGLRSSPGKVDCILLDHSGNIRRFLPEFEDIYHNGFRDLDSSEKLDAKPREEAQHEAKGCPGCGRKPFFKCCLACGYQKPSQVLEDASVGQMEEIRFGKGGVAASSKMDLWRQCCGYARAHSAPDKQQWRAKYLYQDMTGERPPAAFAATESAPVSKGTRNKIQQHNIAWRARQKAEAAQHAPT